VAASVIPVGRATLSTHGGWSLVDVLLSTVFLAVLTAILHGAAIASLQALRVRAVADDLDETARIALEIMARDIRDAGYGLAGGGLRRAGPARIALARDFDLDGETSSANELVAYEVDGEARQLRRQAGNASPQPMVDNLVGDQPSFRFRDAAGDEISPPGGADALDDEQRAAVRRIEITLRLEAPHPVPGTAPIVVEHRVDAGLRNAEL
jgi:type II secretory pathway component PulJ